MYFFFAGFLIFLIVFLAIIRSKAVSKHMKSALVLLVIIASIAVPAAAGKDHIVLAVENLFNKRGNKLMTVPENTEPSPLPHIIKMKEKVLLEAPLVRQMPELPRGCEVTSLAMLLQYAEIPADKMILAQEVKKNPAVYKYENGKVHFGDPNEGFVGDMYSYTKHGLGVYHKPIKELAENYLPGRVYDMTGAEFADLKIQLSDGRPVWIIINTTYKKLDDVYFETWQTENGPIKITYKEHSVLMTGYDSEYVYFNDPLTGVKNQKASIKEFEQAWIQMGRQAITYVKKFNLP